MLQADISARPGYRTGFRDTRGWSLERDEVGPHAALMAEGEACAERLCPGLLEALADGLSLCDEGQRKLASLDRALQLAAADQPVTAEEAEAKSATLMDLARARYRTWLDLESEARRRQEALGPTMGRLWWRLQRRVRGRGATGRVDDDPSTHEVMDPVRLKSAVGAFFRFVPDPGFVPERLTIRRGEERARFNVHAFVLELGAHPTVGTVLHELGHALEAARPAVARAAMAWRDARATDPEWMVPLRELFPRAGYGEAEHVFEDHFVSHYVGKVYGEDVTEVVSTGLEHFTDARAMLRLFSQDPEHFLLVLGALSGGAG